VVEGGKECEDRKEITGDQVLLLSNLQCKESTSVDDPSQGHTTFDWEKGSHKGTMHGKANNSYGYK
jgi:hypothetical protein